MTLADIERLRPLIPHLGVPDHVAEALTKPQPVDHSLRLMQEDMLRAVNMVYDMQSHPALGPTWRKTMLHAIARYLGQ